MQWSDTVDAQIQALKPVTCDQALKQRLYQSLDLTSLNDDDSEQDILALCKKAQSPLGHVAAVCVLPKFVTLAKETLKGTGVKVATVANFPSGHIAQDDVLAEILKCVQAGADEIDVVLPYERYLAGDSHYARNFVRACKTVSGEDVPLKVILETGALVDPAIIADASFDALASGADYIKTSTGKITEGASMQAATTMLLVIKHTQPQLKHIVGLKISGGIREINQAAQYLAISEQIMGENWANPATFRIGASKLVDALLI